MVRSRCLSFESLLTNEFFLGLLKDIPNPEILLASNPNYDDIAMVCFINYLETFDYLIIFFILDQELRKRSRSSCERYESRE